MRLLTFAGMISLMVAISWITTGCKGSIQTADSTGADIPDGAVPSEPIDSALDKLNPQFAVTPLGGRRYSLTFVVGAGGPPSSPGMAAIRSINSLAAQIYSADGTQLASLATQDVTISGTGNAANGTQSLMASGGIEWSAEKNVEPGTYAIMMAHTEKGVVMRRLSFPSSDGAEAKKPVAGKILHMWVESNDRAGGVEFTLHVSRLAPGPEGEYMPSGEKFRIELENSVGETIWSSSRGKSFTQAIGEVEPIGVGEEVTYRILWDGRDRTSAAKAPPGVYRIVATIPAKPTPYTIREEFTWSGR